MVKINGEMKDSAGMTVSQMLEENGYDAKRVAVEVNLEILPKANYAEYVLKDEDSVEVVQFVGGGWLDKEFLGNIKL